MKTTNRCMTLDEGDAAFAAEVKARSGQNAKRCMQCGKCTAGCPVGFAADMPVSAVMRLIQEGRAQEALGSSFIWLCAQCRTCSVRCPQEIDVAALMGALRTMSWKRGTASDRRVRTFLGAFVSSVRRHGRIHELGLMLEYALKTGRLFDDVSLAPKALGKLSIRPHEPEGAEEVRQVVERFLRGREQAAEAQAAPEAGPGEGAS